MGLPGTNSSSLRAYRAYFLGLHKEDVAVIQWLVWTVGVAVLVDLIAAVTFKQRGGQVWIRDVRLAVDILPQHKIWSTQKNWFSSSTARRYRLHLIEQVVYLKHNDIINLPILKCTLESSNSATDSRNSSSCILLMIVASFMTIHVTPCGFEQWRSVARHRLELEFFWLIHMYAFVEKTDINGCMLHTAPRDIKPM